MPERRGSYPAIGVFVSPHGFGHASRACAILEALLQHEPRLRIELFTRIPRWFFSSLGERIRYHETDCDLGLVQSDAFEVDFDATLEDLACRLPFDPAGINRLAERLNALHCQSVICDIAPLGLAAAAAAGIPSVLVENFTWDWIYQGLADSAPALSNYAQQLRPLFQSADLHIQAQPICESVSSAYQIGPVARAFRLSAADTRSTLGLATHQPLVFISMGGRERAFHSLDDSRAGFPAFTS